MTKPDSDLLQTIIAKLNGLPPLGGTSCGRRR